jgi:ATP-dependent DNA helicase RecG
MTKFDSRKLMEHAIAVMRKSIEEPRADGKASPLVGVVLWKPDGTVETACRGELRNGDHAEYTLLERKNRHCKLDGGVLFTTLEPCAPGSRQYPKLGCVERIVLARIKQVWIGIEDPDPTVDRKGIKYLQNNGVTVHMFDRDLQEEIHKANKAFIGQALERAASSREEKKPKIIMLSPLENAFRTAKTTDFSTEALEEYRSIAVIKEEVRSHAFNRRFVQQGLLKEQDGRLTPTGFGLLLFGKEPRTIMPQAGLLATIHYPDGREEPKNFDGPMVLIPGQLERWLNDKLPNVIDRSRMQRREIPPLPFEMVREAVVNALIHRDYDIRQAKCQLTVRVDTITVRSPGGPLAPITLEQLQTFKAPMLSRNPELHYVFARMELAEERGFGLMSMKANAETAGLPLPKYAWEDPYLVLTLFRSPAAAVRGLSPEMLDRLNADERASWQFIVGREFVTSPALMKQMDFDERKAQRVLRKLLDSGLLHRVGRGPATRYKVIRP